MKNLILGFLGAVIFGIFSCVRGGQTETIEMIKIITVGSLWLTPIIALFFYSIQFAGISLVNDFINGDVFERVLIIAIITSLIYVKFIM